MRLHNPIPEINANPFPLFGGRVFIKLRIFARKLQNFQVSKLRSKGIILVIVQKVQGTYFANTHGHNMLQSAVTSAAHGSNDGDHIHISTGDSSVLDSQSSIQDKTTT